MTERKITRADGTIDLWVLEAFTNKYAALGDIERHRIANANACICGECFPCFVSKRED